MSIMSGEESLPSFGVLWQVEQVAVITGWPRTSLNPDTSEMVMGKVLNKTSPRATDCCAAALLPLAEAQLANRVKALGLKAAPELMPTEKGCCERNTGPPFPPWAVR